MSGESLREKAISGAKWRTVATYASQLVQFATAIVLAWLLDRSDYGLMAAAMVVISLIRGFTSLGMNYAIINRRDRAEEAVQTGFAMLLALAVVSYAVMLGAAPFSSAYRREPLLLWVLGLLFFLRPVAVVADGALYREFRFRRVFVVEFGSVALSSAVAIVAAVLLPVGSRYWALALAGLSREAARSALSWALCPVRLRLRFDPALARELFDYGKYMWAATVVMVLYSNIERLALMELLPLGALGLYHFAHTWVTRVGRISETIFGAVSISVYAKLQDDTPRLREAFCRIVGYSALVSTGLLAGLVLLVPEAVTLTFPGRWRLTIPVFQVLGFYYIVRAIDTTTGQLYAAIGKPKLNMYLGIVNTAVMAATVVPLVLWLGAVGAAWCVLIARLATMAANAFVLRRVLRCPLRRLGRIVEPPLKAALAMALVVCVCLLWAYRNQGRVGWLSLGGLVVVGAATYALTLLATERELFGELLALIRDALGGRKATPDAIASG